MDFVLDNLPRSTHDIFVDASGTWGVGGCCGRDYFAAPWATLVQFRADIIARQELLACLIGLFCFLKKLKGKIARIHTDNRAVL